MHRGDLLTWRCNTRQGSIWDACLMSCTQAGPVQLPVLYTADLISTSH